MKTLFTTAAAVAITATGAFAQMTYERLPAGNEWNLQQLENYITGLDEAGFRKLDSDQNDMVSRAELQAATSQGMVMQASADPFNMDTLPAGDEWQQEQLAEYVPGLDQAKFNRIDSDQNGKVTRQELQAAGDRGMINAKGYNTAYTFSMDELPAGDEWQQEQLSNFVPGLDQAKFNEIDSDKNDRVSRAELEAAIDSGTIASPM
ncbi:MAG: hypothetical protein ACU0AT_09315 [Tranquillimonas sp.]|jgi:Ca2+-binding EF-hand superfamily protein